MFLGIVLKRNAVIRNITSNGNNLHNSMFITFNAEGVLKLLIK